MKFRIVLTLFFVTTMFVFLNAAIADDDPVKIAPKNYKVILENDEVRVLDFTGKAGDKIPMHFHPDHTAYVLKPGKAVFTSDGKPTEIDMKEGQALFVKAGNHTVEVKTGNPHVIIVEMKEEMMKK
jgi:quercetin dioxygenase-like cupin family protein